MAIVVRRYRRVGTSNGALQLRVSATGAINAEFTNVIDIDVNNAVSNAVETLDQFMSSIGFPLDALATAVNVSAHASRHNGAGADAVPNATTLIAGLMSPTDKTKLDGITSGAGSTIVVWGFQSIGASADTRFIPIGLCDTNTTTARTTEVATPCARAGTLKNMRVYHSTPSASANLVDYTLMKNAVAQTLTVSLAANSNGPAADTTHSVAIVAGDLISVRAVKTAGILNGTLNVGGSMEFIA